MQTVTDGYRLAFIMVFLLIYVKCMIYAVHGKDPQPILKPALNLSEKFKKRLAITLLGTIYIIFFYTIFTW